MKKISETIAKVFSAVALIPVASLSFIACTNKTSSGTETDSATKTSTNISQSGNFEENNIHVGDNNNNNEETPSVSDENKEVYSLNGIYTFTGNYSVNDIVYANEQEVLKFFGNVRTLSSAKNAALELGFNEFVKSVVEDEQGRIQSVRFSNTNEEHAFDYCTKVADLTFILNNTTEGLVDISKLHYFTIAEDGTYETGVNDPLIIFDSSKNEVTMLYQFCYEKDGKTIETPIYLKTTLTYEDKTDILAEKDASYLLYKDNSVFLNISDNHQKYEEMTALVAEKFGIKDSTDVYGDISAGLSKDKIAFAITNENKTLLIGKVEENSYTIVPANANGKYNVFGLEFSIEESALENEVRFVAWLDEEVSFEFTLSKIDIDIDDIIGDKTEETETPENKDETENGNEENEKLPDETENGNEENEMLPDETENGNEENEMLPDETEDGSEENEKLPDETTDEENTSTETEE